MRRIGRNFLLVGMMLAAAVAAGWPSVPSLSSHWENTSTRAYTHGYAIAAVVIWLVWRARHRIDAQPLRPWCFAVPALVVAGTLWYVAWVSGIQIVHESLLPILMLAAVAAVAGWRTAGVCAFPIGYLYFAIPVWGFGNDGLQSLTAVSVSLMLRLTGVRAYVDGNFVHIPAGTFEIAGGCSGLHFVIVALAIAALQGEVEGVSLRTRVVLLAMAGAMAIVTNWVRVYGVILNGYFTDMRGFLVTVDHYVYGWILFALMMCLYFWVSRRVLGAEPVVEPAVGPQAAVSALHVPALVTTLAALAVAPTLAGLGQRHVVHRVVEVALPDGTGGWVGPSTTETDWSPHYPGADGSAMAAYESGGHRVDVYANVYRYQAQGHELVAYDNDLLRGLVGDGPQAAPDTTRVAIGALDYVQLRVRAPGGSTHIVGHFQVVGGRRIESELGSKLYYAVAVLIRPTPAGIVAVEARCGTDCTEAARSVRDYLGLHWDALQQSIARSATTP